MIVEHLEDTSNPALRKLNLMKNLISPLRSHVIGLGAEGQRPISMDHLIKTLHFNTLHGLTGRHYIQLLHH